MFHTFDFSMGKGKRKKSSYRYVEPLWPTTTINMYNAYAGYGKKRRSVSVIDTIRDAATKTANSAQSVAESWFKYLRKQMVDRTD